MAAAGTKWSPGNSPATSYGGRPSGTRTTARLQSRRREEEMSRGTVCSPRARVDDRRRTRWTDGAGIVTAAVGRRRRGRGRWRRSRVPELDCTEEEGEGSEAELLARFDLPRWVPNVGGERRRTAMSRPSSRLGLGFRRRVKRRGRRSTGSWAASLCSTGGQGARGARGRGHEGKGGTAMATGFPLSPQ